MGALEEHTLHLVYGASGNYASVSLRSPSEIDKSNLRIGTKMLEGRVGYLFFSWGVL